MEKFFDKNSLIKSYLIKFSNRPESRENACNKRKTPYSARYSNETNKEPRQQQYKSNLLTYESTTETRKTNFCNNLQRIIELLNKKFVDEIS